MGSAAFYKGLAGAAEAGQAAYHKNIDQKREERLLKQQQDYEAGQSQLGRDHTAEQAGLSRDAAAAEGTANRALTASEGAADRAARIDQIETQGDVSSSLIEDQGNVDSSLIETQGDVDSSLIGDQGRQARATVAVEAGFQATRDTNYQDFQREMQGIESQAERDAAVQGQKDALERMKQEHRQAIQKMAFDKGVPSWSEQQRNEIDKVLADNDSVRARAVLANALQSAQGSGAVSPEALDLFDSEKTTFASLTTGVEGETFSSIYDAGGGLKLVMSQEQPGMYTLVDNEGLDQKFPSTRPFPVASDSNRQVVLDHHMQELNRAASAEEIDRFNLNLFTTYGGIPSELAIAAQQRMYDLY